MTDWTEGGFPRFDLPVPENGYQWWYVDAMSDDGRLGLTLIAFIGNVFSPYYAAARRRNRGHPENHVALNVALYGARKRWSLTERGERHLARSREELVIGPSTVRWTGDALEFEIDEWTVPVPGRLRGKIRLIPGAMVADDVTLDPRGQHFWWPLAPQSRAEVMMERPDMRWSGHAYCDANRGLEPLEAGFVGWNWSRAHIGQASALLYEGVPTLGDRFCHALRVSPRGELEAFEPPALRPLPPGPIWRAPRETRSEAEPRVLRTFEDTPFYTRSRLASQLEGQAVTAMHESLDLTRFDARWVQTLLPFRMPRVR